MAYLTDAEKRILFSALSREEKVCKTMDRLEKPKGTPLVKIVESLRRKFYYDRFEKEIRAKAIDEFVEKLNTEVESFVAEVDGVRVDLITLDYFSEFVFEVAEELKGVRNE